MYSAIPRSATTARTESCPAASPWAAFGDLPHAAGRPAASGRIRSDVVPFAVKFKSLTASDIEAYVSRERAYDCAGGFRAERLGCALFERMCGDDPTALLGLPMIRLCEMLRSAGLDVLRTPVDATTGAAGHAPSRC